MGTKWLPDLSTREGPRYRAIVEAMSDDLAAGRLQDGARMPPMRRLAEGLEVTLGTVYRAYELAERRGLLSRQKGRGSFLRAPAASQDPGPAGGPLDLTRNQPPEIQLDAILRRTLVELGREADLTGMLGYGAVEGLGRHRGLLARWLGEHGVDFPAEALAVTNGAQQALTVSLAALSQPGTTLLVEALSYPGIKSLARIFGLRLAPVALDAGGLRPDALAAALTKAPAGRRLLYCMPQAQNPTTASLDEARRREIAKLAADHDLLILEDDVYPRRRGEAPPPLAHFAPERTVYISSLSKVLAPGLRVGVLASPAHLRADILAAAQTTNWMAPPLMAELACRWIESGTARELEAERNRVIARLQSIAGRALGGFDYASAPDSPNIWLPLDARWRGIDLPALAAGRGLLVSGAEDYAIEPGGVAPALRLSLTERDEARLAAGLEVLAALLREGPGPLSFRM